MIYFFDHLTSLCHFINSVQIEYFHNDLPTPIPERPQLNRIQFKCSFRGLEIWYEFEHPDGSRIDKREIWFYKKEVGPASSTFAEEYEGVSVLPTS